jgi:DNA-binding NtrC family response regulator
VTFDRRTLIQTGLAMTATRGRTVPRAYSLQVVGQPIAVALGARTITVGAHATCDLVLTDPQVSRKHAELSLTPDGIRVKDLSSTNGTWFAGNRIGEVVVTAGSTIQFGNTPVRIAANDTPSLPPSERDHFGKMAGQSVAMRELFAVLEMASPSDATVLIEGESGTGKELAAQAIHDASPRAAQPFVVVDCSAISEALIDSHLFGHIKGAFTGADRDRKGAFVEANGGTLFLDELGELPLAVQAKLLRVLEAQTVQPVGADRPIKVDTRVVAATHRDLQRMVAAKEFRFDLFYRLAVVHVALPPLRDRLEDLPHLVATFYARKGLEPGPVDGENLDKLRRYAWPGNVRELRNAVERAIVLGDRELIMPQDLPPQVTGAGAAPARTRTSPPTPPLGSAISAPASVVTPPPSAVVIDMPPRVAPARSLRELEKEGILAALAATNGNKAQAAAILEIDRSTLYKKLKDYEIEG